MPEMVAGWDDETDSSPSPERVLEDEDEDVRVCECVCSTALKIQLVHAAFGNRQHTRWHAEDGVDVGTTTTNRTSLPNARERSSGQRLRPKRTDTHSLNLNASSTRQRFRVK